MSDEENTSDLSPENAMLKRHKEEGKQLQITIQKLKKSVNKDKKRKKEVLDEIAALENELCSRHAVEIAELRNSKCSKQEESVLVEKIDSLHMNNVSSLSANLIETCCDAEDKNDGINKKISKAEKRRQKKCTAARERDAMIKEAEKLNVFSNRSIEANKIKAILKEKNLQMREINPDGNCLYAAIAHQLGPQSTVSSLRLEAANYIRSNQDDFLPFITDPKTGDLLTPFQFEEYCHQLQNTSAWGGQPELRALSQILKRKIEVLQADSSPIVFGEEFTSQNELHLAYYRHYYGLGEHYNSVEPLQLQDEES